MDQRRVALIMWTTCMWLEYARLQSIWKIWIWCLVGYSMRVLEPAWIRASSPVTPYLCWDGPLQRDTNRHKQRSLR